MTVGQFRRQLLAETGLPDTIEIRGSIDVAPKRSSTPTATSNPVTQLFPDFFRLPVGALAFPWSHSHNAGRNCAAIGIYLFVDVFT